MKKMMLLTPLSTLLVLALSSQAMAASLDVTFTATLRETTCDMKIEGGTGDGNNNTIPIGTGGKTSLADIVSGSDAASTTFKLKIVNCPASLAKLKTTVTGSASGYVKAGIVNAATTSPADYMAVTVARVSAPDAPFEVNSTDDSKRLVWTTAEISSKEVPLVARLVETQAGKATTGNFSAIATFNFTYE
ncbi:fimbrial protein [Enterobacter hormaechei]|uniref:Fimbrial protein n=2 Tax=Enterobacter hormaechei TaxID=158836 RepID=A0ABD4JTV0_9ENTR|nr:MULTISPECIES: fimbrial protein [Enterobacter]EGK61749.1 fimbrial protein [Enterobacter hormaechei ATCC 49162]UAS95340.1 fimbrial protein [Enterobacter cloacae complex sp.]AJB69784.1 fimbrial protein [Enterobacter hormaechei subsp. hormaechei]EGQ5279834.1 fimbrial protein [Enterobacter hormaechei]EGQ5302049.1 fimbrial protein [Enterobacter hormaechei]